MKKAAKKTRVHAAKKGTNTSVMLTAAAFEKKLMTYTSAAEQQKILRYFKSGEGQYGEGDKFIGVKMGQLFTLAKECMAMPVKEMEKMLESPIHEMRAAAVSIMDKVSRDKKTTPARLKEVYDLYMRRHDRINNWDLVDLGCLYMVGCYLFDKPRKILYKMAKSKNLWERRTAILGTCYFIRQGDTDDAYAISALLLKDKEDLVHKAAGWMLRFAGDKDPKKLIIFLDKYAPVMPRTMLRNAIEKFDQNKREAYLKKK